MSRGKLYVCSGCGRRTERDLRCSYDSPSGTIEEWEVREHKPDGARCSMSGRVFKQRAINRAPLLEQQASNLRRVKSKIGPVVMEFARGRFNNGGRRFHMTELVDYVTADAPDRIAPDSASRILRSLKQCGAIDYVLVSRSQSLYELTHVDNFTQAA